MIFTNNFKKLESSAAMAGRLTRTGALSLTVLLAAGACTTDDDPVATVEAATEDVTEVAAAPTVDTEQLQTTDESTDAAPSAEANEPADQDNSADAGPAINPLQSCLVAGDDLLVINFGRAETDPFSGVTTIGDSVSTVTGVRIDPGNPDDVTFLVNTSAVRSAAAAEPATEQVWYGGEGLSINGTLFSEVNCGDQADELLAVAGDKRPADPTLPTTIRSCYVSSDELLVLDLDTAYMLYTGARTNLESVEAVSAAIAGPTGTGETVLAVSTGAVGSTEDGDPATINPEEWIKSDLRAEILINNQVFTKVDGCTGLEDRVAQLDALVDNHPPVIE